MARVNEITNAFEEIVPPSASASASSSTPSKKVPCDVFINHRGPDAKHTLATSIYRKLKLMGLKVFLDEPELELGDFIPAEIQDAMTTSFLHIAILSPTYAESPWCLAELSFMLKTDKKVIPVFYNVEPGDVRWIEKGKGIYAVAFSKHEKSGRYTSEKLQEWKLALQNVSYLRGHIVKENDDKGNMLEAIVDYVQKHPEKMSLVVAKHPVGLDEIAQDFKRMVLESSGNIKIVGIVGMGGCGKTTLAKEYYNKTRFSIYKCSFVSNVRDAAAKKDLHNTQKMMLQDLGFTQDISFNNVERGKVILAKHLKYVQVLIILDDVDHLDQLDSLLPIKDSLGHGSVIVVTSRDFSILTSWGISSIYRMKELNLEHAMKLFCWHAFLQPFPVDGFEYLLKEFLNVCKGLPLSLKVLGGLVQGKSQAYWNAQLNKVSRLLPEDIKDILKVSFDALDKEDKEIFLDISCFFVGEPKHLAMTVWDGSGWSGMCSLETLENKCLVEVDGRNCITMHDHLRDMGKEIAETWSPYRLCSPQQITHIEKQGQESMQIRGIKTETAEFYEECLELVRSGNRGRGFQRRLKILVLGNNNFPEELATPSSGLVWLRWDCTVHKSLPLRLSLRNLRILELRQADKLEQLWSDTADPPVQLRELNISGASNFLGFPRSIGCLKHLKKISLASIESQADILKDLPEEPTFSSLMASLFSISLSKGASFESLPKDFCRLQSLEHLELTGCGKLKSLPGKFGDLTNLRHLDLSCCSGLMKLPISFKQLIHLQYIALFNCSELTVRLDILENMTKLETFNVRGCLKLQELPPQITNQGSLKTLDVSDTSLRELPNNIGQLSKLEALSIGTDMLKTLPPSIGNLSSLISLDISCQKLKSLPETLGQLTSLHSLNIYCQKLKSLPETLGQLTSLHSLNIFNCPQMLKSLPEILAQLTSLHSLDISKCPLTELAFLSGCFSSSFSKLKKIDISSTLVSKISISQQCCPSLETLTLYKNPHLVEIDSLPISLKTVSLWDCSNLKSISRNCGLVELEQLTIRDCGEELYELPNFAELVSLKEFQIVRSVKQFTKIKGLENCRSLERLKANTWWKVPLIQNLEHMESLRTLELSAWNISAFEPCLKTIKKWPSECIICARAARGVEAIVKSCTFPGLTMVDSCVQKKYGLGEKLTLKCGQRSSSSAVLCFVINSVSYISLKFHLGEEMSQIEVNEGKWVWMGVFTQLPPLGREEEFVLYKDLVLKKNSVNFSHEKDMGLLLMGEERRVLITFYELLQYLGRYENV